MSLLDSNRSRIKKSHQKITIKARFNHYHPLVQNEKELSPWDQDDHFIQLPRSPLSLSLQNPYKPETVHLNPELWSPKTPSIKAKDLYDPKILHSQKQEVFKPSLVSIEFDKEIKKIANKTQHHFALGTRHYSKEQSTRVKLFKKIMNNSEKEYSNIDQNTCNNNTIDVFSSTFTEKLKGNEDTNLICPTLPKRKPKFTKKKEVNQKQKQFPTLNHRKQVIEDKQSLQKKVLGEYYLKGGEIIKRKIKELVRQEKGRYLNRSKHAVYQVMQES